MSPGARKHPDARKRAAKRSDGEEPVVAAAGQPPARVFRLTSPIVVATRGGADAIVVDPAETTVEGTFVPLEYDAITTPHPALRAHLASAEGAVIVTLDAPRQVRRVGVQQGGEVRLHRLDGDKPVQQASVAVASNAVVGGDFTDRRFAIRSSMGAVAPAQVTRLELRSYPTAPRAGVAAAGAADAMFFWRAAGELGKAASTDPARPAAVPALADGAKFAGELQRFVDALEPPLPAELGVELVFESDAPCSVRALSFSVAYVLVTHSFAAPRFARGDVLDAGALAHALREGRDPLSRHVHARLSPHGRRLVERGDPHEDALLDELNALVDGGALYDEAAFAGAALSPATRAAAAAGETGDALRRLNRALLHESYAGLLAASDEKRVLRFARGRTETRGLTLQLPGDAHVTSAELETIESFRGDRPARNGHLPEPGEKAGVRLDAGVRVAAAATPASALPATGIALALVATSGRARVLVELREDHGGAPAGRTLVEATASLEAAGRRAWSTVAFPEPIVLQPRRYWIVLAAASGSAVWLGHAEAGDVRVLERDGGASRGALGGVRLLHELLTRSEALQHRPAVQVAVGGTIVEPKTTAGDARAYDLAATLNALLAAQPGSASFSVPLTFTAATAGSLTVQPPEVAYDLP